MNIKLKISKEFNFLMIIYQKLKQQQMFENLNFNLVDTLTKENRKIIKSILRSGNISFEEIEKNELIGPIYRANKNSFVIRIFAIRKENLSKDAKIKGGLVKSRILYTMSERWKILLKNKVLDTIKSSKIVYKKLEKK